MSKRRKQVTGNNPVTTKSTIKPFRYAEMLEAVGRERVNQFIPLDKLLPNLAIADGTQEKLMGVVAIMDGIGKLPGDLPKEKFDQPITYHKLPTDAIEWLENNGFRARKTTPLATYSYRYLFGRKGFCVVEEEIIERFFSHFIHCLLVETQIILSRQYYHGLGFYRTPAPIVNLLDTLPSEIQQVFSKTQLSQIAVDQLHGKIFVDYCAVMIRAQWDKLISLSCLALRLKQNWDSITDGIKAVYQEIQAKENLHPACKAYLAVFLDIATERVKPDGWLKNYRDSLIHSVGQHSSGVVPHKKSIQTTSELWDQVCEEHNWLREGMMSLLIALATKNLEN